MWFLKNFGAACTLGAVVIINCQRVFETSSIVVMLHSLRCFIIADEQFGNVLCLPLADPADDLLNEA